MDILEEFNNMDKFPIFEVAILDENNEVDYLIFNIECSTTTLEITTEKVKIDIDDTFSLDEHLQYLYDSLLEHLMSEGYNLA